MNMILPYRTIISVSESKLWRIGSFLEHLKALGRSHLDFHLEKLIFYPSGHLQPLSDIHLSPIRVDAEPAEAGYGERHNDVDQDRGVGVREVKEDEDDETESFDEKVGRDPDKGWVDQLVVVGTDADHEEDAGGRRDG